MAVYTSITQAGLNDILARYDLGALVSFEGIARGVSNTNYHVFTTQGRYILTVFEERRTRRADLPFLFAYARHLSGKGIACPQVCLTRLGEEIIDIQGKAGALISFLEGEDIPRGQTGPESCAQMGAFTARMHLAAMDFPLGREPEWNAGRYADILSRLRPQIAAFRPGLEDVLEKEIRALQDSQALPGAVVHTDLFPDNVFFKGERISAMIDMYFACTETLAYDLAIVINAWCFDGHGVFVPARLAALMQGYESVRPLQPPERDMLQKELRRASLRFLMSRLEEFLAYDDSSGAMTPHDPTEYIERLEFHRQRNILE